MVEDIYSVDSKSDCKPNDEVSVSSGEGSGEMQFCMSNYQKDVLKMMSIMQNSQMLTDIILEVGSELFYTHKLILAAASPYFKAMFTGGMRESVEPESRVRLHGICPTAMSKVLGFMYSGQINISEHTVCQLLSAAAMFQIVDVLKACCVFLERQLAPMNAIGIAKFAEQHGCIDLKEKATRYILNNFSEVCLEEEFLQLSMVEVIEFIRKDDLNVKDEREVYNAVIKWIKYDRENRESKMHTVMSAVRCQYLTPSFLKDQMKNCEVLNKLPACREYLAQIFKELTLHKKLTIKERSPSTMRVIYVAGGFKRNSIDTVEALNTETGAWISLAKLTVPRSGLGGAFVKGVFYAVGGRNITPGASYDSDWVDRYDPARDLWRPCNPMSTPRNRVGVGVLDGLIYACGGSAGTDYHNSIEKYDPDEDMWTLVNPMLRKRIGAGVAVVNRILYVMGGFDGIERLKFCECYHPESDIWTPIAEMKDARSGSGIAAMNQYIYMIGGFDGQRALGTVERYNTETGEWSFVSPMREPRSALSASVLDDKIYTIGGYNGQEYVNTVEIYDAERDLWMDGPQLTFARSGHTSCVSYLSPSSSVTTNE